MNAIEFWKNQVQIWNTEQKCGFCWTFGGATDRSGIERYKIREGEECCVHVFITDRVETNNISYPNDGVFEGVKICSNNFTLWVLVPSRIDLNNYNEIDGHPISESIEETIITPLRSCLGCGNVLQMCESIGYLFNVTRWDIADIYRTPWSNNFAGLRITASFSERN